MSKKTKYPCTISKDLLSEWQRAKRANDIQEIVDLGVGSYPTIQRALAYGYVAKTETKEAINKFFSDRLIAENEEAEKLKQLSDNG